MIAEKSGQSLALLLQFRDIERTTLSDKRLLHGRVDELLAMIRKIEISHGIQAPEMAHINLISHLCLLRIALGLHIIIHLSIEIAVFIELVLSHLRTQLRIHILHQLRLGSEHLGNPSGKSIIRWRESIPYPQTHREWGAVIAATHKSSRRGRSQGILHLLLHGVGVAVLLVVGIFDRLQSRKKLLAFLQGTRRGAPRKEEG